MQKRWILMLVIAVLGLGVFLFFRWYCPPRYHTLRFSDQEHATHLMGSMHFYYGTLHSHTRHSDGLLRPEQALWWARYVAGYDFYALTDHARYITPAEWEHAAHVVDAVTEPGKFVALRGFEWGSDYSKINHAGHVNVYNTHAYVTANTMPNIQDLYAWIVAHNGLAHFNHPKRPIPDDAPVVADAAANIFGMETGNKRHGNRSARYLPYYQQALDAGWQVAPVYGQDNHLTPIYPYRTVIIAQELMPDSLLGALQARRVYSTDDPTLRVVFKLGEHWMGSMVRSNTESVVLTIFLESECTISEVEIFTNNAVCVQKQIVGAKFMHWEPAVTVNNDAFFYLKITTRPKWLGIHRNIAVSAPIWVQRTW